MARGDLTSLARTTRFCALIAFLLCPGGVAEAQPCTTVQLCIALDGSGTIRPGNFDLMKAGLAQAAYGETGSIAGQLTGCTIDPLSASNPVGEQHSMTISVRKADGSAAADVDVTVEVVTGPNAPTSGTFVTDNNGEVDIFYIGDGGEGTDAIEAHGTVDGMPFSCTATKTWTTPQPRCAIAPQSDTNSVNSQHQLTVRLTVGTAPQPGIGVTVSILSGPNSPESNVATTDANGEIDVVYTGDGGPGTDTISASGTVNGIAFSCMATKTWVLPPPVCNVTPFSDTNPVGTRHDMEVTVTRGGVPQSGVGVNVGVTSGPNSPHSGTFVTNPNGKVSVFYVSNGQPGTDSIAASGSVGSIPFSCNATKEWVAPTATPSPIFTLTKTPTCTPTPTRTVSATATPSRTPLGSCGCVGDCYCDRQVTIDEILTMVSIAIGGADLGSCPAGDPSGDQRVTVDEILTAISNALDGCG